VTFDAPQATGLRGATELPGTMAWTMDAYHAAMTNDELQDPAFTCRVVFVPRVWSKASKSDTAIEFIKSDSDEVKAINAVLLKEVDKARQRPRSSRRCRPRAKRTTGSAQRCPNTVGPLMANSRHSALRPSFTLANANGSPKSRHLRYSERPYSASRHSC
jgi:hypothetical protein